MSVGFPESVLVVVVALGNVVVSVVNVVDVPIVLDCLMPAVGTVLVAVVGVLDVGERVFVVVAVVLAVGMAVVNVIDVAAVFDGDVSAVRAVRMAVVVVDGVVGRGHRISFAWLTASATMWATWWSISEYTASRPWRSTSTNRAPRSTRRC